MIMTCALLTALVAAQPAEAVAAGKTSPELQAPVPIQAAGASIDVVGEGHSAPFLADINGDGLSDLLVGQYTEGRLRIYLNSGTATEPRFDEFTWLLDGAETGRVPTG